MGLRDVAVPLALVLLLVYTGETDASAIAVGTDEFYMALASELKLSLLTNATADAGCGKHCDHACDCQSYPYSCGGCSHCTPCEEDHLEDQACSATCDHLSDCENFPHSCGGCSFCSAVAVAMSDCALFCDRKSDCKEFKHTCGACFFCTKTEEQDCPDLCTHKLDCTHFPSLCHECPMCSEGHGIIRAAGGCQVFCEEVSDCANYPYTCGGCDRCRAAHDQAGTDDTDDKDDAE